MTKNYVEMGAEKDKNAKTTTTQMEGAYKLCTDGKEPQDQKTGRMKCCGC